MSSIIATSGQQLAFPSWGRSFWQDPNDGELICLYASGTTEVDYIRSTDGGVSWSAPVLAFPVDDFSTHDNFDTAMDRAGNVHCVHRFNGSGCYTLLGKLPAGNWAASGVVARGFFAVRSTVAARDFNGSIDVYDTPLGFGFADPTSPPTAQIVAVDSTDTVGAWYIDTPFTTFPTFRASASAAVGPSGGFPVAHNAGLSSSFGALINIGATGIHFMDFRFAATTPNVENIVEIDILSTVTDGSTGDVPFNPNMAWCRPQIGQLIPVLASIGQSGNFELYSTSNEPEGGTAGGSTAWFGNVNSTQPPDGTSRLSPSGAFTFKNFLNDLAGGDQKIAGGVPVDISHYDEFATVHFYFQQRRENGDQTIFRIKANLEASTTPVPGSRTVYTFSDLSHPTSGIVSWADVSLETAGAGNTSLENKVHWQRFKAVRHPTPSNVGVSKREILTTIGSGVTDGMPDSISKLYMWRFEDSVAASGGFRAPTFVFDYTSRSGTLLTQLSTNGMTNADNFFDQNVQTSGQFLNADQFTLEFSQPLTFNRMEIVWQPTAMTTDFIDITMESSFDNVNFAEVFHVPTGQCPPLVKMSAENEIPRDSQITFDLDGFAGRYIRWSFLGGGVVPVDAREVRLYGGHSTSTFIATSGLNTTLELSSPIDFVETFNNAPTGLPQGWRTYGDFNWFVDTGIVQSGFFTGQTVGSGDHSAVRPDRDPGPNESGVLEVDVNITSARTITFDLRLDLKSNVGQISPSDPNDDLLEVFVVTPTGTTRLSDDAVFANQFLTPVNYYTVAVPVTVPGLNTIRWVYNRGNLSIGQVPRPEAEAVAWIDNVKGLDKQIPFGTIYGYLNGEITENEEIYGYVEGAGAADTFSFAWMNTTESALTGVVNAYHQGEVSATGAVNAYIAATGDFETIAGFMEGFIDTAIGTINGYMLNSGSFDFLFGHMQSRFNESINGYLLAPSGAFSSINAYIVTPETLVVNGYLKTEEEDNILVNAYLKADGIGDQINGFMLASGLPSGSINGYIRADGAFDNFNGYLITGDDTSVAGYIQGAAAITGVINAWISGVGEIANSINAYIPGISGVASDSVNGFISAVEVPANNIHGYIIGFGEDDQCNFPVINQPIATVPTGNFFN
jgi:hypothetical protein